ncbi:hypothetical protein AAY473_030283 [Plecturocebus cupreus]
MGAAEPVRPVYSALGSSAPGRRQNSRASQKSRAGDQCGSSAGNIPVCGQQKIHRKAKTTTTTKTSITCEEKCLMVVFLSESTGNINTIEDAVTLAYEIKNAQLHGQRPKKKTYLCGSGPGSLCCVHPRDVVPCISVAPAMAERNQCKAQAMASEGTSPKPWQLPHGIVSLSAQKSRSGVWEPLTRFQTMYGNAWMPRQKFAAGAGPSWRTSARAVQKGTVES